MKNKFADKPPAERAQYLADNCYASEIQKVRVHFTAEQSEIQRRDLTNTLIDLQEYEDQLQKVKTELNMKIKPLKENQRRILNKVRHGYEEVEKNLFAFDDQEAGEMHYFDELGEFRYTRRLTPHERQTRIVNIEQSNTGA